MKEEKIDFDDDHDYFNPELLVQDLQDRPNSLEALPEKSREKYNSLYQAFMEWRKSNNIESFEEDIFMTYFLEKSSILKPSTLWSQYSMLKSTININHEIDISKYRKLIEFLKKQSDGFCSKKAKILTSEEVKTFLRDAPDQRFLATKVALIFGVIGSLSPEELTKVRIRDLETHGDLMLIKVPNAKTKKPQSFVIGVEYTKIVQKYAALRPRNVATDRFFLNYQKGKCTVQVIGKNKFCSMPKEVAKFLNLPEPMSYTGHSFRRTSIPLHGDFGSDVAPEMAPDMAPHIMIKCDDESKSNTDMDLEDSYSMPMSNQKDAPGQFESVFLPSTSSNSDEDGPTPRKQQKVAKNVLELSENSEPYHVKDHEDSEITVAGKGVTFHFSNCINCVIHLT